MSNSSTDCPTLNPNGPELDNTNVTIGTVVKFSCPQFGHRIVGDSSISCLDNNTWSNDLPECKWTGEFTTDEKLVLGASIGGGALIIVLIIVIIIAYFCCYKRRKDRDQSSDYGSDNVSPASSKKVEDPYIVPIVNGHGRPAYPDAYYAYQEYQEKPNSSGIQETSLTTLERPWLGYIPRPKVSDGRYYH